MNLQAITQSFLTELQQSAAGKKTSLAYIANLLPTQPLIAENEPFQAFAIGGTNYIYARVKASKNAYKIEEETSGRVPFFDTKDTFLGFVEHLLYPDVNCIAISFGWELGPVKRNNKLDGIFLGGAVKEHVYEGFAGEPVGEAIEQYVLKKQKRKIQVTVANDTICLLLSGRETSTDMFCSAGIVGTGLNLAYFSDEYTAINLEDANFDKFPPTKTGRIIYKESQDPASHRFEKEIAGAYLYQHANLLLKEENISNDLLSDSEDLDRLARTNQTEASNIARSIMRQSAELVACSFAALTLFKKHDMTFVMQGSLFWKGYLYKEIVENTAKRLALDYTITFKNVEDADILGAAKLVR